MVIIDGGGGNGNELPKSRGREAFVGGDGRRDGRSISVSAVINREAHLRKGPRQRLGVTCSYFLLCLPGPGGRTLSVAEAETKRGVGPNSEEVK